MTVHKIPLNGKVAVLGGGISGLTYSYFLKSLRPDLNLTILEKSGRTGGYINTLKLEDTIGSTQTSLEKGPRTLRGVSDGTLVMVDILTKLNEGNQIRVLERSSLANRKYLLSDKDEIVQVPDSFATFWTFARKGFTKGIASLITRDLFITPRSMKEKDESIESFFKRRYGNTNITDRVLSGIMHGIYAGDISKLSIRSILPSLAQYEDQHGSLIRAIYKKSRMTKAKPQNEMSDLLRRYQGSISFNKHLSELFVDLKKYPMIKLKDGLEAFPRSLTKYLSSLEGVDLLYYSEVKWIDPVKSKIDTGNGILQYDHIHCTINSNNLANHVVNTTDKLKSLLQLKYVSILLCNVYAKGRKLIPEGKNGFGFLVPKSNENPERLLGVIFDSDVEKHSISLFNGKADKLSDEQKVTLMIGGHHFDDLPEQQYVDLDKIRIMLKKYLNLNDINANIVFRDEAQDQSKKIAISDDDIIVSYNLIKDCIPQFNVGYNKQKTELLATIEKETRGFTIGGMSFGDGVGVPDCIMNSFRNALKVC